MTPTVTTLYVAPFMIRAHHGVTNRLQVRALTKSMRQHGWRGRQILGERLADGRIQAWTGSHRLPAARLAGLLAVPVRLVDRARVARHMAREGYPVGDVLLFGLPKGWYDERRAAFLTEAGDTHAAALLDREISEKAREDRVRKWARRKSAA